MGCGLAWSVVQVVVEDAVGVAPGVVILARADCPEEGGEANDGEKQGRWVILAPTSMSRAMVATAESSEWAVREGLL